MSRLSVKEVGERLAEAGRLKLRPLCVYGSEAVPEGIVPVSGVVKTGHLCLAKAILLVAAGGAEGVYVGIDTVKDCCYGAFGWLGMVAFSEDICNELSVSGADAHFLKESPEHCSWTLAKIGQIKPPGKYVVARPCAQAGDVKALSYLCFGTAEQVRNLCGLLHFGSDAPFGQIDVPWGSHCALFVTYPAGLARGAPRNTAFVGPTAPDGNPWFPPDLMAIGIPTRLAKCMACNVERSFVARCPDTTYPRKRDREVTKALKKK